MKKIKNKNGFTLAETMIVLVILGVIAAITVPGLVRRNIEGADKAKIKKAMMSYDLAINKMVIENGIKDNTTLSSFAGNTGSSCSGAASYFKQVDGNGCNFKTADGLWWDISDIQHPIVALKRDNLNVAKAIGNTNETFYFVGHFDDNTGILRVNDLQAESGNNKTYLTKLYLFVNPNAFSEFEKCSNKGNDTCSVNGVDYSKLVVARDYSYNTSTMCLADSATCSSLSGKKVSAGTYFTTNVGENLSWNEAAAKCQSSGGSVASAVQLQQMNSNRTLRCKNGTVSCTFWTSDQTQNGSQGMAFAMSGNAVIAADKNYKDSTNEVICVGN